MSFATLYANLKSKSVLRRAQQLVERVNKLEPSTRALSDEDLKKSFSDLPADVSSEQQALGFALVREAAHRALGLRHFDVQLVGGYVLLNGMLAEMRTGEGKTLTVTLAAAMHALHRRGVHVVTANSYLARRDAELMRPVYEALGLTVAATYSEQSIEEKQAAYACDVTYGVGSEFGFDYLKDHMVRDASRKVQRELFAAVVDEVDSVLIDEARVPLIIADSAADVTEVVQALDQVVRGLTPESHFQVNLKERRADLTEAGYTAVEEALVRAGHIKAGAQLYDAEHLHWVRKLHSAVKAYALFRRDRDYVVEGGELVLVDTGTGRKMQGRRFEDGLHEALEAREGLRVRRGTVTKATITYQSFFALYSKLAGLTGTALTEAEEFSDIYKLETVVVPTNKPVVRKQLEDLVFLTKSDKFQAAVSEVARRHAAGQPVLVGCSTIRDAEVISKMLASAGVPHETLTARHIEREAHIIAEAGRPGAVTVATNMAGRGTDILLGGEPPKQADAESPEAFEALLSKWEADREQVLAAGGLFVLGTERNGIRRVDNQLAGRSGRQGNPGEVQFLLSLEDDLLKVFSQSGQLAVVRKMIAASGSALGGASVAKLVTTAQRNVESAGFGARKSLMQFDSVLSDQRNAVYSLRDELLGTSAKTYVQGSALRGLEQWVAEMMPADSMPELWDAGALKKELSERFNLNLPLLGWVSKDEFNAKEIAERVLAAGAEAIDGSEYTEEQCRGLVFDVLDDLWTEHLAALNELRENVSLKGHTGFNAVFQFHKDAFALFQQFEGALNTTFTEALLRPSVVTQREEAQRARVAEGLAQAKVDVALQRRWVTRNESCPCGSGKRFKDCHGKLPV